MKTINLAILLLLSPLYFFAQQLTGLWIGALSNDSTTIRKEQSFEIALTEYKGKVYGYSRSEFIVNDTLYFIVKRVKGTIEGDVCEVKDDEIISYNFRGKLEKGVKVVHTFRLNKQDSAWYLDGEWKTNATKKYYALTGKTALNEEKDLGNSKIFPHLEELNLGNDIAFYKEQKDKYENFQRVVTIKKEEPVFYEREITTQPVSQPGVSTSIQEKDIAWFSEEQKKQSNKTVAATETSPTENKKQDVAIIDPATNTNATAFIPVKQPVQKDSPKVTKDSQRETTVTHEEKSSIKTESVTKKEAQVINEPTGIVQTKKLPDKNDQLILSTNVTEIKEPAVSKEDLSKTITRDPIKTSATDIQKTNSSVSVSVVDIKTPVPFKDGAAALVNERKSDLTQVVEFKSDSLLLSLYDNGEIDGDTVSVLLNGEVIMAKQCLKATAIKKTIYIPSNPDETFTLVLYAENLGKYPPNTGLLVVRDGDDIYNVRFSADLQRNAAIVFRRKPN